MGQERRHFTDEFKTEAVVLLVNSGRPLVQSPGSWASPLDATQLAYTQRRAESGVGAASTAGVGRVFHPGPDGGNLPASPRE